MRLRTLKPGFFKNEDLVQLSPLTRLLFAGLWCMADRAGRLEDRPGRIKLELFPGDECDVDELLTALQSHRFIQRYEVGEQRLIQVLNFGKHQNPHVKEPPSTLPAPDTHSADTVQTPVENGANTMPAPPDYWDPDYSSLSSGGTSRARARETNLSTKNDDESDDAPEPCRRCFQYPVYDPGFEVAEDDGRFAGLCSTCIMQLRQSEKGLRSTA